MNRKIAALLAVTSCLAFNQAECGIVENLINKIWQKEQRAPETIKLLIVHDKPGVILEVKGKYKIYDPHTNAFIATRFLGKRKFIQAMNDSLRWGEEFPGIHQLKIVPDDPSTTTLVDGIEYKGALYVYDIGGTISVVNELLLDDFLKNTLNASYGPGLPEEAAAAIAIAARTNAWYFVKNPKSDYFAVDASKVNYRGHAAGVTKQGMDLAIAETKNMILTKEGAPLQTEWNHQGTGQTSLLSLEEVSQLARKGDHAAQILSKAFPGSKVSLLNE